MTTALHKRLNRPVPQTEQATPDQIRNHDVGYVFKVSEETALRRYLLLGSEGGTFYQKEAELTDQGIALVRSAALTLNPDTFVNIVVEAANTAPKRTYALFALAVGLSTDNPRLKEYALTSVNHCVKTGTDFFELISYLEALRGWGSVAKKALNEVLLGRDSAELALWTVKYRDRHGWTWRDALRVAKPKRRPDDALRGNLFEAMLNKEMLASPFLVIEGWHRAQETTDEAELIEIVKSYGLPWEALRDDQRSPAVWKACMPFVGQFAVLRNLATYTRNGLDQDSEFSAAVRARLERAVKLHPITLLNAGMTYSSGGAVGRSRGGAYRAHAPWMVGIENALENSFSKGVTPTNKRFYVGVDCSPSMQSAVSGSAVLQCRQVAGALALAIAKNEPNSHIAGFSSGRGGSSWGRSSGLVDLGITEKTAFADAMQRTQMVQWGGTDCALPMLDAIQRKLSIDVFVVITDNETNSSSIHPFDALRQYRAQSGIPAKLAVVALTATNFSIADPSDAGMMDFCGFSSDLPKALEVFATL